MAQRQLSQMVSFGFLDYVLDMVIGYLGMRLMPIVCCGGGSGGAGGDGGAGGGYGGAGGDGVVGGGMLVESSLQPVGHGPDTSRESSSTGVGNACDKHGP